MFTNNQVAPTEMTHNGSVVDPPQLPDTVVPTEASLNNDPFVEFRRYIKSKTCYNEAALSDATVLAQTQKKAYQVDMYTLMEKRWITWNEKPFGREPLPNQPVGNQFSYFFEVPHVILEEKVKTLQELFNTRHKEQCLSCHGKGSIRCKSCNGTGRVIDHNQKVTKVCSNCHGRGRQNCHRCAMTGYVVKWATINVKWYTIHSVSYHQNTFLPEKRIQKATTKQIFYENQKEYNKQREELPEDRYLIALNGLYDTVKRCLVDFWPDIEKQYFDKHVDKLDNDRQIRKVLVSMAELNIIETDYSSGTYVNKRNPSKGSNIFTFLQYGCDKNGFPEIYENDYPLACCGCCGPMCATQSCCCIIL